LIAILALVAVPGTVGHQLTVRTVSAEAFEPVRLDVAEGTVASTFDPANRSASAIAATATLTEPAPPAADRLRPGVASVTGQAGSVAVARPKATSSGSASAGGWRSSGSSWYGPGLYGNGTACGQTLTKTLIGVAHKTLPCGTLIEFRNPANGRVVEARVVDRGPYVSGRDWDLTNGLCQALDHCYTAPIQWRVP
jgi:rare lipoprotein A (peptidoglycan hydrolase)